MKRLSIRLLRPALACLLLVVASAFAAPAATPLPKDSVYQLPLPLTDQHGRTWDWRSHRGQPQVVAMFYTSCQYMCPLIVDSGKAVEHALTPAERAKLGIMLISMDPKRDTPAALMADRDQTQARSGALVAGKPARGRRARRRRRARRALPPARRRRVQPHQRALLLLDRDGRIVARTEQVGSVVDPEFIKAVHRVVAQR